MSEHRDRDGKLITFTSKPACSFGEVLAVRIEERIERIDSNVADSRLENGELRKEIKELSEDIKHNKEQTTVICSQIREVMVEMHVNLKSQNKVLKDNEEIKNKVEKVEKQQGIMLGIAKAIMWITGVGSAIGGIVLMVFKIKGET